MAKKKYSYRIELNRLDETVTSYQYRYGNISGIIIKISKSGVCISMEIGKEYTVEDILGYGRYYIFPDAIKKALLIYLIKYSTGLEIRDARIIINGTENIIDLSEKPIIYSLITGDLKRALENEQWHTDEVIDNILSFTKTTQDARSAALYAFLCSKTKNFEAERFIYLWMSFNGIYGYVSNIVKKLIVEANPDSKPPRVGDGSGIGYLLAIYGWTKARIVEKDSVRIARKVIGDLNEWDGEPITFDSLESGNHQPLKIKIQDRLKKADGTSINMTVYGYLLGFFAYYFRCNFIHANKPLPLYSYESEYEVKCLALINQMLESFLDECIPFFFKPSNQDVIENMVQAVIDDRTVDVK